MKTMRLVVLLIAVVAAAGLGAAQETKISVFAHYVTKVAQQRQLTTDEAASWLYDLGVRGFDTAWNDRKLPELAATKLTPVNLYGWPKFLSADGGEAAMEAFLGAAEKYGVPRVMVIPDSFSKGGDEEAEFRKIVEGMRKMVVKAKARGIVVTVEDFGGDPTNPCNRMKYLKRFLDEIPDLRLALDSGNLYYARRDEDILELMRYAGTRIEHVHLKDQLPSDRRTYAVLGLGGVPNAEIVHHMTRAGYDGWYTLENTVVDADVYVEAVRQIAVLNAWRNLK